MAHNLSIFGGVAEMAYSGQTPWHGLGQEVSPGAPLETWLEEAKMLWSYQRSMVRFFPQSAEEGAPTRLYPGNDVIYRSDNLEPLSVVSDRYKAVQPKEMIEFFRTLVEQEGFEIETIGSLKGGRRIWAMAKTHLDEEVNAGDRVKANLLLITSCDGSLATTAKFISTRVVCWNTQAIALAEDGAQVKVRHNTHFDAMEVKGKMGLVGRRAFGDFMKNMTALSKKQINQSAAEDFVLSLVESSVDGPRKGRGFKTIMNLFNGGQRGFELPGVRGTAWGLLNAMTEYADHHVKARTNENRLNSAWWGSGAALKAKAEEQLLELVK